MLSIFLYSRVMKELLTFFTLIILSLTSLHANVYSYRKYSHVKDFYSNITADVVEVCKKYKLPPAAVLAIAGLESGYGRGYVAQITGNILSLGAFKGDKKLPGLYLPYSKSKDKVLFDPKKIKMHKKNDLVWKKRPESYKRDYRPAPYVGTIKNLELLKYNSNLMKKAHEDCLNDFATRWIVKKSNIKAFANTRIWLDKLIAKNKNTNILFNLRVNKEFINRIGGHPKSFNNRAAWPKKAKAVMKNVGLIALLANIEYKKMNFNKAWSSQ